ncbi:protein shq1 [Favolaschia claudopus]|uniref:Protein shq1 n=1 Tax=Favolaschia claudopus TaxID=2862362 RepID=A0AAW0DHW2_9AGAR
MIRFSQSTSTPTLCASISPNYDPNSGYLTVILAKESKLLAPRPSQDAPLIEVMGQETDQDEETDDLVAQTNALSSSEQEEILLAAENDRQLPQQVSPTADPPISTSLTQRYGFLNAYSGYFRHVAPSIFMTPIIHFFGRADYADDEYIQELLLWENPSVTDNSPFQFTEKEKLTLLNLPRKEYLADAHQTKSLYLTLVTVLFAYAYETSRTTQGDSTPESAWTICSLVPAFSALDPPPYSTLAPTVTSPIIPSPRTLLLRALLKTKYILDHHEVYYVYSKIWVDDFCVWVQASARWGLQVPKRSIGWELEDATRQAQTREADNDDESEEETEVARQL